MTRYTDVRQPRILDHFKRVDPHNNKTFVQIATLRLFPHNEENERRHRCENVQRRTTKKRDAAAIERERAQGNESPSVEKVGGGGAQKAIVSSAPQLPVDGEVQVQEKMSKRPLTQDELDERRERRKLSKKKSKLEKVSLAKQVNDADGGYPMPLRIEEARAMTVDVGLKHPNGEKSKNALTSCICSIFGAEGKRVRLCDSRAEYFRMQCALPDCDFLLNGGLKRDGEGGDAHSFEPSHCI